MTDRELLELAAKAAGMYVLPMPWPSADGWFFCVQHDKPALHFRSAENPHRHSQPWMPLRDDGDALRLAVKLCMSVDMDERETSTYAYAGPVPRVYAWEMWRDDKAAATRRAIVRAAAELGKGMQ